MTMTTINLRVCNTEGGPFSNIAMDKIGRDTWQTLISHFGEFLKNCRVIKLRSVNVIIVIVENVLALYKLQWTAYDQHLHEEPF